MESMLPTYLKFFNDRANEVRDLVLPWFLGPRYDAYKKQVLGSIPKRWWEVQICKRDDAN